MSNAEVRPEGVGRNQHALRDHNERLILTTLSRNGPMPGSEISRVTHLSPQTVSVILRALEQDGMLKRGTPQRGKVGKPSVPMRIAPDGAYSIGVMVGRRTLNLVLTDLTGAVLSDRVLKYIKPTPEPIIAFLSDGLNEIRAELGPEKWDRVSGIGIAQPYQLWAWHASLGAGRGASSSGDMAVWEGFSFERALSEICDLEIYTENDATAAAQAEQIYGVERDFADYAYFFIGAFIGGGIILNNATYEGRFRNAGAFGSLPMPAPGGGTRQLIDTASLHLLDADVRRAGLDASRLWDPTDDWSSYEPHLGDWIEQTADQIALATLMICAVVDFEAVVIDGAMPVNVRARIVARTLERVAELDTRGLYPPRVLEGSIGKNARALGAAANPIQSNFFLTPNRGPV